VDFRPRPVAFTTGISATSGTAHGSSRQLHLFELRFLVLTVSSLPRARRSASEAQDVQVQIFPVGRAFSAVPGVATGRRVLKLPRKQKTLPVRAFRRTGCTSADEGISTSHS